MFITATCCNSKDTVQTQKRGVRTRMVGRQHLHHQDCSGAVGTLELIKELTLPGR